MMRSYVLLVILCFLSVYKKVMIFFSLLEMMIISIDATMVIASIVLSLLNVICINDLFSMKCRYFV